MNNDELKKELLLLKLEFGLSKKVPCSKLLSEKCVELKKSGKSLPEDVFTNPNGEFFTIQELDLSEEEIAEYLNYKKIKMLKTIKNCVVFFTVLTVISMIVVAIMLLNGM